MKKYSIKISILVISFLFLLTALTGCVNNITLNQDDKINVVTTIFPPYDFVREISGDNVRVSMLLKPGMESHSYEPSPADIIAIENCDLFIYNGGESDAWVDTILDTIKKDKIKVIKMVDCVDMLEEEHVDGMEGTHRHEHEHEHSCEGEPIGYDEHIWTSPLNAIKISERISSTLVGIDPANKEVYENNLERYKEELTSLHKKFLNIVEEAQRNIIVFGDRFPFRYFAQCYSLEYRAAFPGCSAQTEPSAKTVAYLIDRIREDEIPNIFYIEFSNMKIAKTIQEETGAEPLMFHSCHNLSKDERDEGLSYLDIMNRNAENLREALR